MPVFALRIWLPDRPGALGQVASRIGAVRGDVVGIEILERGVGQVVDELLVELPDEGVVELLLAEIAQVDGVAVEDVHPLADRRYDGGTLALQAATRLATCDPGDVMALLCGELVSLTDGDWAVAIDVWTGASLGSSGGEVDIDWVAAFLLGSRHLEDSAAASAPPELAWAHLHRRGAAVAVERRRWPFRSLERQHVADLGRLVDALPGR
jgi:hypothetical protein